MTYDLAKQLKDAGFPQIDDEQRTLDNGIDSWAYSPTLSELIEACLEGSLEHKGSSFELEYFEGWRAQVGWLGFQLHRNSLSSEEAVAKLWLALNRYYCNGADSSCPGGENCPGHKITRGT